MSAGGKKKVCTNATLTQFRHLKQMLYHQPFQIINHMAILLFSNNNKGIEIFLGSGGPTGDNVVFLFISQHFFILCLPSLECCSVLGCYPGDLPASVSTIHQKMVTLPVLFGSMITFLAEDF